MTVVRCYFDNSHYSFLQGRKDRSLMTETRERGIMLYNELCLAEFPHTTALTARPPEKIVDETGLERMLKYHTKDISDKKYQLMPPKS